MRKHIRLHKYIANCGYCSRRHAERLISAGLVQLNGKTVTEPGTRTNPSRDRVVINGELIVPPEPCTIMLHKPSGFISSTHDTHDRLTVMDLLPRSLRQKGVVPVGRLDLDTEGLLLMTNDGDLHHLVTHPRYGCPKEYYVKLGGKLSTEKRRVLEKGVQLEDGPSQPVRVVSCRTKKDKSELRIELSEGRKREVKRIFAALGQDVTLLKRLRIGPIRLGNVASGKWRNLTEKELRALRKACSR